MAPCVYYLIRVRLAGAHKAHREFMAYRDCYHTPYGGRAFPAEWYRTDNMNEAHQFETPGKARGMAKRLNMVKEIIRRGGAWEIVKVTSEVVEASDAPALLQLAKVAK